MEIFDQINADQIEVGDQIIVDGDEVEVKSVTDSSDDVSEIIVTGYSHSAGETVTYSLPFDYSVSLWGV